MIDITADLVVKQVNGKWGVYVITTNALLQEGWDKVHANSLLRKYRKTGARVPKHYIGEV
jgi:glutathione synthase/RimK-type ligase-like ATP-grasp enzyme